MAAALETIFYFETTDEARKYLAQISREDPPTPVEPRCCSRCGREIPKWYALNVCWPCEEMD